MTDRRQALVVGNRGQEYLEKLEEHVFAGRFRRVDLSAGDLVKLNGLRVVVGQARSGELEVDLQGMEPRRITEAEVIASYQRQGRYRSAPVLHELLSVPEKALAVSSPS